MTPIRVPHQGDIIRHRKTGALGSFVRNYHDPQPVWVVHYDGDPVNWAARPAEFEPVAVGDVIRKLIFLGVEVATWQHTSLHRFDACTYAHDPGPAATCTVYRRGGASIDVCIGCVVRATEHAIEDTHGRADTVTAEVCTVEGPAPSPEVDTVGLPEVRYPSRTEFRVTFGTGQCPHPRLAEAHPDGWLAVVAETELDARVATIARIGRAWSFIYGPDDSHYPTLRHYPRGEVYRIVRAATFTDAAASGGDL